jgi:hypothetical protein
MKRRHTTIETSHPKIDTRAPLDFDRLIYPLSMQIKILANKIMNLLNPSQDLISEIQNF